MNQSASNPILDHLFARMAFNLIQCVSAGNCVVIEISELEDDEFCAHQLLEIARDEGEQDRKPIQVYTYDNVYVRHRMGALLVREEFREEVSINRLGYDVKAVILRDRPIQHLLAISDTCLILSSDGEIQIRKNRAGDVPTQPIPWEHFRERQFHINDLLGRKS